MSLTGFLKRPYTRGEIAEDAAWFLYLCGALFIQSALVRALNTSPIDPRALVALAVGLALPIAARTQRYWAIFGATVLWVAALAVDCGLHPNLLFPVAAPFGFFFLYKMLRYRTVGVPAQAPAADNPWNRV